MIEKLYKFKQQQINQQLMLKQQVIHRIADIDNDIEQTTNRLHGARIDMMGAISDFRVLQIHKETMKQHIIKLHQKRITLQKDLEKFDSVITQYNKESEQFSYILQLQLKEKAKKLLKKEEDVAVEYMQAKFITNRSMDV
ncbi:MAG: hypothetical protein IE909_01635 [Campylobacterales bacterium]|nr:hypothetical protein [Campylobacterales bacterium]